MRSRAGRSITGLALVLWVSAAASGWAQEYHDSVVVILDASMSMDRPMKATNVRKIDAAKKALKAVLTQVPDSTYVGLLVFSAKNFRENWLYPLGPRDTAALLAAIDRPEPGDGTPLGEFIKVGADRLLEERDKQFGYASYRLLIVTDGEATDAPRTERYFPEVLARGITVDVIGVDMKQDHTLATKAHSYRRADDPAELTKALAEVLGEVPVYRDDAAEQEAFSLLAPIPVELGAAMVEAVSRPNNKPIRGQDTLVAPGATAKTLPAVPPRQAPRTPSSWGPFPGFLILVVILVMLAVLTRKRAKR